jgi:hypothetical protein
VGLCMSFGTVRVPRSKSCAMTARATGYVVSACRRAVFPGGPRLGGDLPRGRSRVGPPTLERRAPTGRYGCRLAALDLRGHQIRQGIPRQPRRRMMKEGRLTPNTAASPICNGSRTTGRARRSASQRLARPDSAGRGRTPDTAGRSPRPHGGTPPAVPRHTPGHCDGHGRAARRLCAAPPPSAPTCSPFHPEGRVRPSRGLQTARA